MPELPEVETTLRGLAPHLTGQVVADVIVRNAQLRWPIPQNLGQLLRGQTVRNLKRRAKYLLLEFDHGTCAVTVTHTYPTSTVHLLAFSVFRTSFCSNRT